MALQKVLIVGAGIGGLTAAAALRKAGIEVDVVEDKTKWTIYHVGIIIQANALWALDPLGLAKPAMDAGFVFKNVQFYSGKTGALLAENEPTRIPGHEHLSDIGITRPALHEVLFKGATDAGAKIRLGVTHSQIDDSGPRVKVTFTDGSTGDYDLVVAADGAYSKTRRMIFGDKYQNKFTGQSVWRYNLPRPKELVSGMMFDDSATKGSRAGLIPLDEERMYVLLVSEEPGNPRLPADQLAPLFRERLKNFGGAIADFRDQITDSSLVVYRPLEGIFVDGPWYQGRVLFIGDAMHTPTPHLAQGAGMAIEDAAVLGQLAAENLPVDTLLERFMARRLDRCRQIWSASVQCGQWEMNPTPDADVVSLMRKMQQLFMQPI